jgi:hypothetical protein
VGLNPKKGIQRKVAKAQSRKGLGPIARHERAPLNRPSEKWTLFTAPRFAPSRLCDLRWSVSRLGFTADAPTRGPLCPRWLIRRFRHVPGFDYSCTRQTLPQHVRRHVFANSATHFASRTPRTHDDPDPFPQTHASPFEAARRAMLAFANEGGAFWPARGGEV